MDNPEYSETAVALIEDLQNQQLQKSPSTGPREGALLEESNTFASESQTHLIPSTRSHLDNLDKQEALFQLVEIANKYRRIEQLRDLVSSFQALLSSTQFVLEESTLSSLLKTVNYDCLSSYEEDMIVLQCVVMCLQHAAGDHQKDILQWLLLLASNYRENGRLAEVDSALMEASSIEQNVSNINEEILDAMREYVLDCVFDNALVDANPWTIKLLLRLKDMYAEQSALVFETADRLHSVCFHSDSSLDNLLHLRFLYIQILGHEHDLTTHLCSYLALDYALYGRMDEAENLVSGLLSSDQLNPGQESETILKSMKVIADMRKWRGQLGDAEALLRQVLAGHVRIFGIAHDKTFGAMVELLGIIRSRDRTEAMILDLHVFAAKLRMHSANTLHIWEDFKRLALLYNVDQTALEEQFDSLETSEEIYESVVRIYMQSGLSRLENQLGIRAEYDSSVQLIPHGSRLGTTGQNGGTYISAHSSVDDAFSYLVNRGCADLTIQVDLSGCTEAALSGGRFGDVWRGWLDSGTQVAIKCLRLHTISDINPKAIKHATRELCHWSRLKHPNVLELLGFATYQGQLAMISPWMSHGTLCDYVRKYPRLNRWQLCTQVAEGLEYIHSVQMSNILVSEDGMVKLSDFGNSVFVGGLLGFSATNIAGGGTARWMAPELIKQEGADVADRSMAADVYALGMTILEVMTGKLPFHEHRQDVLVTLVVTEGEHPKRPIELAEGAPFGTKRWEMMVSCWSFLPQDRPSSRVVHRTMMSLS
ncbi:WD repeat-containing protein [Ceratobasidium sp. AG-Ba]|nr:WD repeat-containing protein [Ceratobasidium sp. AG-Ba]